jgi:pimeloyl-ACP methyl ester carboxylesterase
MGRRARASGQAHPQIGRFVRVAGRRVHVLCRGQGVPVLLLHGNGGLGQDILAPFPRRTGVAWIAPDRPGYGFSEPLHPGAEDPASQARWAARLLDALGCRAAHVVAHSIAGGLALCLASAFPDRVLSLTLINPFVRPTPHRWKPGLRLAVAPGVGRLVRPLVPPLAALTRRRALRRIAAPNAVPPTLCQLPLRHAARGRALLTVAAELRSFNDGMMRADPRIGPEIPVLALLGGQDPPAIPEWHAP